MLSGQNTETGCVRRPGCTSTFRIDYDARLAEEAVLLAMKSHEEYHRFRSHLDRLYEMQDAEERDTQFRAFHTSWFARLKLGQPVKIALNERPIIARSSECCFVIPAQQRREESAELFVRASCPGFAESCSVGLKLQANSFLNSAHLLPLLRHELLHIADMLDPAFEYDPSISSFENENVHPSLIQERYRVLWDATIDGRLIQEGLLEPSWRARRKKELAQIFPMLGTQTETVFAHFFDSDGHTHAELLAHAVHPEL